MQETFSTMFYIRQNKPDKLRRCIIYLRITINGQRAELSTQRKIELSLWNPRSGKAKSTHPIGKDLNLYLNELEVKAFRVYERLKEEAGLVTSEMVRDELAGRRVQLKMVCVIYENHNQQILDLVNQGAYSKGSYWRHCRTVRYLKEFMQKEYGFEDIPFKKLDLYFISRFEHYLRTTLKAPPNTITKYVINFKKIVRIAYANDWIAKDPFYNWKAKWKVVERQALTERELKTLMDTTFNIESLENVKNIFLFCCFTDLSCADVKKLTSNHIVTDINCQKWIKPPPKPKQEVTSHMLPHAEVLLKSIRITNIPMKITFYYPSSAIRS
jgi:hypothetical protein